ncbi:hypothetical protein [Streptomyces sp. SAI-127]|uniref:hypothetical protein n=1 Tax=Streptomyces sp. SAI-127 TaxID=2940543 RepID=UPI0024756102|nr:hypothetical protein [Streptomyces sp. SAI-127]MDH6484178.1 hypothetical protein [Streptomyces sp. SAI-127]
MLALYEPIGALYFQGSASTGYSGLRKAYEAMPAGTPKMPSHPHSEPLLELGRHMGLQSGR